MIRIIRISVRVMLNSIMKQDKNVEHQLLEKSSVSQATVTSHEVNCW